MKGTLILITIVLFMFSAVPVIQAGTCSGAYNDNTVWWGALGHNTFDTTYRSPFGAVKTDQSTVTLRFRTCHSDVTGVRVRVWDDKTDQETWYTMSFDYNYWDDPVHDDLDFWKLDLPIPTYPTILYYMFEIKDGSDTDYYIDDDIKFYGGGWGTVSDNWDDSKSFQLTVYDKDFVVPEWLKGAVIYQIFPDRFRNGDTTNDPVHGTDYIYGDNVNFLSWEETLCDPRNIVSPTCQDEWGNVFYGGDLQGVIDKLDYLEDLGVTAIYLNPIFKAPSNHLYDTQDYKAIDPYFGTLSTFQSLATQAEAKGIKLILDGVFNHTSSDSPYFDSDKRWNSSLSLLPEAQWGTNDGSGACESISSPYRSWYTFTGPGSDPDCLICIGGCYYKWGIFGTLPKLNAANSGVRDMVYDDGTNSVARYWVNQGADGWRFDVGDEIDPGLTHDPNNTFWEGFRTAVKAQNSNAIMLGEVWGDVSPLLLGNEWDSVMNYRFRSAMLDWMFNDCSGNGCGSYNGFDKYFQDNDNNMNSAGGEINYITESQFDLRLKSIQEDYPPQSWKAMMNLMGSHDTNRILWLLKKISNDSASDAIAKLKFLSIFQYTYVGAPTVYYGTEAGLAPAAVWDTMWSKWEDDPYNRAVYPWSDKGPYDDSRTANTTLISHYEDLGTIHNTYSVFKTGDYQTLHTDDTNRIFVFRRYNASSDAVVIMNRHNTSSKNVTIDVSSFLSNGTTLTDVLNSGTYTVSNGNLTVNNISNLWGVVLVKN
jgi:glycosidase